MASGRFGVTPEFAVNADQLEIKIAQGAKPGLFLSYCFLLLVCVCVCDCWPARDQDRTGRQARCVFIIDYLCVRVCVNHLTCIIQALIHTLQSFTFWRTLFIKTQVKEDSSQEERCLLTSLTCVAQSQEYPSSLPPLTMTFTPSRIWLNSFMTCIWCAWFRPFSSICKLFDCVCVCAEMSSFFVCVCVLARNSASAAPKNFELAHTSHTRDASVMQKYLLVAYLIVKRIPCVSVCALAKISTTAHMCNLNAVVELWACTRDALTGCVFFVSCLISWLFYFAHTSCVSLLQAWSSITPTF